LRIALPLLAVCLMANSAVFAQGQGRGRGGFGGGFGGGMMGGGGGVGFLLRSPQVQKELKMTDEQTAKVGEIQREAFQPGGGGGAGGAGGGRGNFQNMTDEERAKFFEDMRKRNEETNKKLTAVLSADQNTRLKQIQLWVGGAVGLVNNADAVKELGITDDQKEALKTITDESGKKGRELFQNSGLGPDSTAEDRAKFTEKTNTLRKETETECMAVLTDEQKAQFNKMRGEKFELDMSQMGFGGPGGPGGGRRGRPGNNNN
jgi:Spy/CpxP family protein refolding chaperone